MRVSLLVAACLLAFVAAQNELNIPDNLGKNYELAFGPNLGGERFVLNFASLFAATVTITRHQDGFSETLTLAPGVAQTRTYNVNGLAQDNSNVVETKGFSITSDKEISVAGGNVASHTTDGFTAIPNNVLGTEYFIVTHGTGASSKDGYIQILAIEDGTDVTVTLTQSANGHPANTPFTVSLNAHQSITFTQGADQDLSGSYISSNKKVAVYAGHDCANIPNNNVYACDHIDNQMPPADSLGKAFLLTPFGTRTAGDVYRVVATEDGTTVTENGSPLTTLNRGQVYKFERGSTAYPTIEADKPVLVGQFMKGSTSDNANADPAMSVVTPITQWSNDFIFSPLYPLASAASHYVNIGVKKGDESGVEVDGNVVTGWVDSDDGQYRVARVQVTEASHHVRHTQANKGIFTMAYGFASYDSYAFPGGFRLAKIVGCQPTPGTPGDGQDNDCDGRVDEELLNGIDDDGDGQIDEDLAVPNNDPNACAEVTETAPANNGQTYTASNPTGTCACLKWQ